MKQSCCLLGIDQGFTFSWGDSVQMSFSSVSADLQSEYGASVLVSGLT